MLAMLCQLVAAFYMDSDAYMSFQSDMYSAAMITRALTISQHLKNIGLRHMAN